MLRTFQNGDRVWSVERRGGTLTTRYGLAGGKQREHVRRLRYDYVAEAQMSGQIRKKLREGYRETTPPGALPPLDATGRALEQAIVGDPGDLAAHMAFADWLSEQGESKLQAWGEFIRVQLALEEELPAAERTKLKKRERELIEANERDWLGEPLARLLLGLDLTDPPRVVDSFQWVYRRGWVDLLGLPRFTATVARALAGSASLRLLRELIVWAPLYRSFSDPFALLAGTRNLGNVRILSLEDCADGRSPIPLLAALPRLEELHVLGGTVDVGPLLALPSLANLHTLALAALPHYPLDALARSPVLGRLRRLLLNSADLNPYDLDFDPQPIALDEVARALHSPHLKGLTELTVNLFTNGDEGCAEIARWGVLERLEVLDLSYGTITDEGARALADGPDRPRLKKLIVTGNCLSPAGVRLLRRLGAGVQAARQRPRGNPANWE